MNPLLLPPRLVLRALDDLHVLAQAAGDLAHVARVGADMVETADRLERRLEVALELGERIDAQGRAIVERADRMDERAGELVDRLDKQAAALLEQSRALYEQAAAILAQGERVEHAAREVAGKGAELLEALPMMQRAVEMAEPLEGAVERLGRMVDRLPGAKRAAGG